MNGHAENKKALAMRVLEITAFDHCDELFWRTDGEYAPVTFFAVCNDLFFWACADLEPITEENVELLGRSLKDSKDLGIELFCCRSRKMRPQKPYYKHIPEQEKHLFDACGPEREV